MLFIYLLTLQVEDNNGEQRSRENQREATHLVDNSRARRYGEYKSRNITGYGVYTNNIRIL